MFAFVFLLALGIDYSIFLRTRVCEEARREGSRRSTHTMMLLSTTRCRVPMSAWSMTGRPDSEVAVTALVSASVRPGGVSGRCRPPGAGASRCTSKQGLIPP
ncbi:MAG: MMPL family transporter [Aeromicrobium sp.]